MNNQPTLAKDEMDNRPLYAKIATVFEIQIRSGELKPGDRMPSQNEIMRVFGVSQATVRQALLNLTNQGLVIAQQGRGVFVAEPRTTIEVGRPDLIGRAGGNIGYELLGCDMLFAPDRMALLLEIEPGTNIMRCRRRILSGDRVVGLETSNIPLDVMQIFTREALDSSDLRKGLAQSPEFSADSADYRLSAGVISAFDAEFLDVTTETVVIQQEEVTRATNGRPVIVTRSVYLADLASLHGEMRFGNDR